MASLRSMKLLSIHSFVPRAIKRDLPFVSFSIAAQSQGEANKYNRTAVHKSILFLNIDNNSNNEHQTS